MAQPIPPGSEHSRGPEGDGTFEGADFLKWQRGESPNPPAAGTSVGGEFPAGAGRAGRLDGYLLNHPSSGPVNPVHLRLGG